MKTVKQLCLSLSVCFGLLIFCNKAFSQAPPPPPAGGPPPPPPPSEVFKKINPFKKKSKTDTAKSSTQSKTATTASAAPATPPPGGPPPPPNPLNLFKKKKKDTTSTKPVQPKPM